MQGQKPLSTSTPGGCILRAWVSRDAADALRLGWGVQDREKRAAACFSAAGCYAVTLVLSGGCWIRTAPPLPHLASRHPSQPFACEVGAAVGFWRARTRSELCGGAGGKRQAKAEAMME